jgi:thioredoxin-like negative regulator of GroEL
VWEATLHKHHPETSKARYRLGVALELLERWEDAARVYHAALQGRRTMREDNACREMAELLYCYGEPRGEFLRVCSQRLVWLGSVCNVQWQVAWRGT